MKLTTGDVAFVLESLAHLPPTQAVHESRGYLLLASAIVKKASDEQLGEALRDLVVSS